MTVDGSGRAPRLTAGTHCAPGGQDATILPSVPGEVRAQFRSRPAPPSGLERGCRGRPHSIPPHGREERRDRGLLRAADCGGRSRSWKAVRGEDPTWDCPDAPRLDTALHTSGGGEGLWTCGCPLVPLFSFSLFWGEKPQNFYETPPGRGSLGPLYLPLPHLSPCWNKKRTKPQNWESLGFIFWGCEVNGRF